MGDTKVPNGMPSSIRMSVTVKENDAKVMQVSVRGTAHIRVPVKGCFLLRSSMRRMTTAHRKYTAYLIESVRMKRIR